VQFLAIVALSVAAAVAYGIALDQITVRVCLEYFTVGHPPVFPTDDPTWLALGWGVFATWWIGLPLGVALAVAARAGRRPPRSAASLVRPMVVLLAAMAVVALLAGTIGWLLTNSGVLFLAPWLAEHVPADKHAAFLADGWAHSASYLTGAIGGLFVVVQTWRSRLPAMQP
jgi:hypothetical protein